MSRLSTAVAKRQDAPQASAGRPDRRARAPDNPRAGLTCPFNDALADRGGAFDGALDRGRLGLRRQCHSGKHDRKQ